LSTASDKADATGIDIDIDIGAPPPEPGILASTAGWRQISGPLFRKYVGHQSGDGCLEGAVHPHSPCQTL
jgi:hypothetical protein